MTCYYVKKPIPVACHQWFKNGDHPEDGIFSTVTDDEDKPLHEGRVVRFFRRPDVDGGSACKHCGKTMHVHGWIDTLEGGHIVCPGDWIITGVKGERYPVKPDIFKETYQPSGSPTPEALTRAQGEAATLPRAPSLEDTLKPLLEVCDEVWGDWCEEGYLNIVKFLEEELRTIPPLVNVLYKLRQNYCTEEKGGPDTGALWREASDVLKKCTLMKVPDWDTLDVRKIMVDIVPGPDGEGVEVYAKNVKEVEERLAALSEKLEDAPTIKFEFEDQLITDDMDQHVFAGLYSVSQLGPNKEGGVRVYPYVERDGKRCYLFDVRAVKRIPAPAEPARPMAGGLTVQHSPDGVFISARDNSWLVEGDPTWGIKITSLGSSLIPLIVDVLDRPDVLKRQRAYMKIEEEPEKPIPLIIWCPACDKRHIDEGKWSTEPHHTHACQHCGFTWRPAIVPTVGVQFLPGFKNT